MAYKSIYKLKNIEKYIGDPDKIICRSSWERKVCKYLDENIKVKPLKQTMLPKQRKNKNAFLKEMKTFAINNSKWEAAKKLCDENGWIFKLLTEKEIFK